MDGTWISATASSPRREDSRSSSLGPERVGPDHSLSAHTESILQALSALEPKAFSMSSGVLGSSALTSK